MTASLNESFARRHLGPRAHAIETMLEVVGVPSVDALIDEAVPAAIRMSAALDLPSALSEHEALAELKSLAAKNRIVRTFIGQGYHGTLTPPVIQRSILENPNWYTPYTPYQAEIAQGRLEALLNFQTMVSSLTGLELANASLLDEATAAAEAMTMCRRAVRDNALGVFWVDEACHPQTIEVVRTRAEPLGLDVRVAPWTEFDVEAGSFGVLVQYPTTDGRVCDYADLARRVHEQGGLVVVAADILSLALLKPPAEFGADVAVGTTQRFGVPMGFGGPHAAYFATSAEYQRLIPGRIVGVSKDAQGNQALRLALQTREQHIRRNRATSNICTSQVLLAVMAGMYAVYHGPEGIERIARKVFRTADAFAAVLSAAGASVQAGPRFDTVVLTLGETEAARVLERAHHAEVNLRDLGQGRIGVSFDETHSLADCRLVASVVLARPDDAALHADLQAAWDRAAETPEAPFARDSAILEHEVFQSYHSEHELLRYAERLQSKDLSLTHSMIPLGSCTMKLNAAAEMFPVTWPEFGAIHPFAPREQTEGYGELLRSLERMLGAITGLPAVSLQPNAGSQGEYAGLLAIRGALEARGEGHRDTCLIPSSAHGTNPASAVMAGMRVVVVKCDEAGDIDIPDLKAKAEKHAESLAGLMVTYPSTHGVFEATIREICEIVHAGGGMVYMDGANMNAQVGLCRPGEFGVDVCHLNLHKTFCIPHGGGGPGMGPICATEALRPHLPGHSVSGFAADQDAPGAVGAVAAAPFGSPSILVIPWMYIRMMGADGLTDTAKLSILNANYCAKRLEEHYPILFTGRSGRVAHEFIIDMRGLKKSADLTVADVAKRLMDYGFHAPTMSWPVAGTMMVEPTESESKAELDRFCDALISIREEIKAIECGRVDIRDNVIKNAPHTAEVVTADEWQHAYPRSQAAFPAPWVRERKFWPAVSRIDEAFGDRNLVCSCPSLSAYESADSE